MDNISVIIRNKNEEDFIGFAIQSAIDAFNNPEIITFWTLFNFHPTNRALVFIFMTRMHTCYTNIMTT